MQDRPFDICVTDGALDSGANATCRQRSRGCWTVNDGQRLNELVRLGIDGVTTANLAILQALAVAG